MASRSAGTIVGHAAVWYTPGDPRTECHIGEFTDRIERGAFADSIRGRDIFAFVNHESRFVLGRTKNRTLQLREDEHGLRFDLELPDTAKGRELAELVGRGDITGCSFNGRVRRRNAGRGVRIIEAVELVEVSICVYPSFQAATCRLIDDSWRLGLPNKCA